MSRGGRWPGLCFIFWGGLEAALIWPDLRRRLHAHVAISWEEAEGAGVPPSHAHEVAELSRILQGQRASNDFHHPLMLVRFLTGGHRPEAAAATLLAAQAWRDEVNLASLLREWGQQEDGSWQLRPKSPRAELASRHFAAERWHWHSDGGPVVLARWAAFDFEGVVREQMADLLMNQFVCMLEVVLRSAHAASVAQKKLVRGMAIIDVSGLSFSVVRYLNYFKPFAHVVNTYYPDLVEAIFVVNAPLAFVEIWHLASTLLCSSTRRKVQILGSDFNSELRVGGINVTDLPKFLGGQSAPSEIFEYRQVPEGAGRGLNLGFGGLPTDFPH